MSTEKYSEFNTITKTEEGSERVMILQGQHSHSDVAFPGQMFDITEDSRSTHSKVNKIFEKHASRVIEDYMNDLINMMDNPIAGKTAIQRMGKYKNEKLKT